MDGEKAQAVQIIEDPRYGRLILCSCGTRMKDWPSMLRCPGCQRNFSCITNHAERVPCFKRIWEH